MDSNFSLGSYLREIIIVEMKLLHLLKDPLEAKILIAFLKQLLGCDNLFSFRKFPLYASKCVSSNEWIGNTLYPNSLREKDFSLSCHPGCVRFEDENNHLEFTMSILRLKLIMCE